MENAKKHSKYDGRIPRQGWFELIPKMGVKKVAKK
jgi:hypothetical protein